MTYTRTNKSVQLETLCDEMYKMAKDFLQKKKNKKGYLSRFFNLQSEGEKISLSLIDAINNAQRQMSFPNLSYHDENDLLRNLSEIYKKLVVYIPKKMKSSKSDKNYYATFFNGFCKKLKSIVSLCFGDQFNRGNVNLNYLDDYIGCREVGYGDPSNYAIHKCDAYHNINLGIFSVRKMKAKKIQFIEYNSASHNRKFR